MNSCFILFCTNYNKVQFQRHLMVDNYTFLHIPGREGTHRFVPSISTLAIRQGEPVNQKTPVDPPNYSSDKDR